MKLYFFDLDDGYFQVSDEHGTEIANADGIAAHVRNVLLNSVKLENGVGRRMVTVSVRNLAGNIVHRGTMMLQGEHA